MWPGRSSDEHQAALSRRLAALADALGDPSVEGLADDPSVDFGGGRTAAAGAAAPAAAPPTHTRIRPASWTEGARPQGWEPPGAGPSGWEPAGWEPAGREPSGPARWEPAPTGPAPEAGPPGVVVPAPGRHAARRAGSLGWWGRMPGLFGPAQVAVLAVAAAVGLAVCCWWLLRSGGEAVPVAAGSGLPLVTPLAGSEVSPQVGAVAVGGQGGPTAAPSELVVDVAGRVRRPGITVLEPGARVIDAIRAAGGARRGVDLTPLNLARPLVDGEQILVGVRGGPQQPVGAGSSAGGGLLVNINTAGQSELESLPEVGPVTALAIMAWREAHGGFTSVDQLLDVDGIGEATLHTVTPFVTV